MTAWAVLFLLASLFFAVIGAAASRKIWRGESALVPEVTPEWWLLGAGAWRGLTRALPAIVPFGVLTFLAMTVQELVGVETAEGDLALAAAGLVVFAGLLVYLSITLYNRPRFLVPPPVRRQPGLLEERRRRTRRG